MPSLTTDDLRNHLSNWTLQNLGGLKTRSNAGPTGTRPKDWVRRGKTTVNGQIVRAFECPSSATVFPDDYAVIFEQGGQIAATVWMSETQALQLGLQLVDGRGKVSYWHNGKKKVR